MENRNHPYREALQALLYAYSTGLTLREIADKLEISELKCRKLLSSEELNETIKSDPFTGKVLYTLTRRVKPTDSFESILQKSHKNNIKNVFIQYSSGIALVAIIAISAILFKANTLVINFKNKQQIGYHLPESVKKEIEFKSLSRDSYRSLKKLKDLKRRIHVLQATAIHKQCIKYWSTGDTCYIKGRLLSQKKFNDEIAEMNQVINKIEKNLDILH